MRKLILSVWVLSVTVVLYAQDITLKSSCKELDAGFEWAKNKARSYVMTGKSGPVNISERNNKSQEVKYIPSYWAGYPLRTAFYSRDFCHQAVGAHLLGLAEENYTMLKAFASSANASRKWYPVWAINFDGSIYRLDYIDDANFVREVPAAFELVEKAYQLYLWTGDKRFYEDETLWTYYTKIVTDFISQHDSIIPNGIAEGTGEGNIFRGTATYNESKDTPLVEAGDGIACQYQAMLSYAKMAELRGDKEAAFVFEEKAADLKHFFNTKWGVIGTSLYNRGYSSEGNPVEGWGKENSWFMPLKGLTDPINQRTVAYLSYINERLESKDDIPSNIEALSYVPEVFFKYYRNEEGWRWLKHILLGINQIHTQSKLTGTNGDYPEISYVLISNVVENLAGICTDAGKGSVFSLSHLPKEISSLTVNNILMGKKIFTVSHIKHELTRFHYIKGDGSLRWEASFAGTYKYLFVNGVKRECVQRVIDGIRCSICVISLTPGEIIEVSTTH
ncbi:hypothetical protein ACOMSG_09915 [Macellibacteroides fermentans]|uniref:hypothetical protein n=1 Tax=Macellibacteroides fermentans TaxID=879969 RepID=UPI003B92F4AC